MNMTMIDSKTYPNTAYYFPSYAICAERTISMKNLLLINLVQVKSSCEKKTLSIAIISSTLAARLRVSFETGWPQIEYIDLC